VYKTQQAFVEEVPEETKQTRNAKEAKSVEIADWSLLFPRLSKD
jgi:hypothetical protein